MKAVVVGGAGFIGSNLCELLIKREYDVVCIDNLSNGCMRNIEGLLQNKYFLFFEGDATDNGFLDAVFSKEQPDVVFHLAANSDIQASASDPSVEYRNTYSTTFCILECMRKHGIKKIFFASTSAVYGDKREIELREDTPELSPVSYYGAAKLGSEALLHAYTYMNEFETLIFRFPNVIGSHLTHGVVYDFVRKLRNNSGTLTILGDGRQTKPYIYVRDLVEAIEDFMADVEPGLEIYNLGVSGETSVRRIADIICAEMGLKDTIYEFTGGETGWKGDVPRFRYCLDKIHASGWQAKFTSDEAVKMTVREVLREMQ